MLKDLFRIPNPPLNVPDHTERTTSLLVSQFASSERLKALLSAFTEQIQDLQYQAQNLYDLRSLETAEGAQLDGIGQILNLPRYLGEDDETYRIRLRTRSYMVLSSGTPEEILKILKSFTSATVVEYLEIFPAAYQAFTNGVNLPPLTKHYLVSKLLDEASPAGTQYVPVVANYNSTLTFGVPPDEGEESIYQPVLTGGLAELIQGNFYILQLDDEGLLEINDGESPLFNLLLHDDGTNYFIDGVGAGNVSELFYFPNT